jgi:MscS family membrane protein
MLVSKLPLFQTFRLFLLLTSIFTLLASNTRVYAQFPIDTLVSRQEPGWSDDPLGRRNPRGTIQGFLKAMADENYETAARYMHLDPALPEESDGPAMAQALQRLLDKSGTILPYTQISNEPDGTTAGVLGPDLERVGSATVNGETFNLVLEKTIGPDGGPLWLFSSQTVKRIPRRADDVATVPLVNQALPGVLIENKWGGVPLGHWMSIIVIMAGAFLLSWAITKLLRLGIPVFWYKAREEKTAGLIRAFSLPFRLYLAVWIFMLVSQQVGISIIVRQRFGGVAYMVGAAALLILIWRLIDVLTNISQKRLVTRSNMAGVSALLFLRRATKIALFIFGGIIILSNLGFDVTTWLAALGIGGLALALGAQKTVENFVGSVTLIADQPVRVGDFCKIGDVVGTVEQIGMRSTRIRTLDRTVITIPNGELSSSKIENFAHRDRFRFHTTFGLRFETTPDQIRYLLVELRSILYAHPQVDPDPARIRFREIASDSLNLEIFAFVHAKDTNQFLEIQEDLFLRMMDVIETSGTGFAFPSQTIYIARDKGVSEDKAKEAHAKVQQWREAGDMQIPSFDTERIEKLKSTIKYPPEGSCTHTNGQVAT